MRLTRDNYHEDWRYWSASLVKRMFQCPAAALHEDRELTTALLIGQYVDTALTAPKRLDVFKAEHPELYRRDGMPKAETNKAAEMVIRARRDPVFMEYMKGRKQVIRTGKIDGLPFKIMMDVYRKGERIVDLKTVRDMRPGFAEKWDWPLQMAIYREIEGNALPCFLAVISKEDPPDIAVIEIPASLMDAELDRLRDALPLFDAMRRGIIPATRCGCCAYCRKTKQLSGPVPLDELP